MKIFELPPSSFPMVIEAFHPETKVVVWTKMISTPGLVEIPPLHAQFGHIVSIRVKYADGSFDEATLDEEVEPSAISHLETCAFGATKVEALEKGVCIQCGKPALERCYSSAGRKEYRISGLCELCFDSLSQSFDQN
jgi:hypothetical protein